MTKLADSPLAVVFSSRWLCKAVASSLVAVLLACRPSLPADVENLRIRTQTVTFEYVPEYGRPHLIDDARRDRRIAVGRYVLVAHWPAEGQLHITLSEQGNTIANLACIHSRGSYLVAGRFRTRRGTDSTAPASEYIPPPSFEFLHCRDEGRDYAFDWTIGDGTRMDGTHGDVELYSNGHDTSIRLWERSVRMRVTPDHSAELVAAAHRSKGDVSMLLPTQSPERELATVLLLMTTVEGW